LVLFVDVFAMIGFRSVAALGRHPLAKELIPKGDLSHCKSLSASVRKAVSFIELVQVTVWSLASAIEGLVVGNYITA